jgi:hypothetical protein
MVELHKLHRNSPAVTERERERDRERERKGDVYHPINDAIRRKPPEGGTGGNFLMSTDRSQTLQENDRALKPRR